MKNIRQMLRKTTLFLLFFAFASLSNSPGHARTKYNFNSNWKVFVGDSTGMEAPDFNDSQWKNVTLPYAWNQDEAFKADIKNLSTGIAWYRKHFVIPEKHAGQKVFIEIESIRQAGEVYVNGEFVGLHENGVMAVGYDITDKVKFAPGENVIAMKTDNSWDYREKATNTKYQWNNINFNANYGGINKNVWLHVTDKLYQTLPLFSTLGTTGQYIYARDIDVKARTAEITAETQVKNEHPDARRFRYEVVIEDMANQIIKTIDGGTTEIAPGEIKTVRASASVDDLYFWSWGYGYLYTVATTLYVEDEPLDIVKTRTGFRKTEFANGMIKLNDRVLMVKGYAQRSTNEWPAVGMSVPPWMSDFSNRMMVESNGNLVRWMHVTPAKQDVESCDRVGLIQAMPAGDSEGDSEGRQWEQRVELMRDAIIYNRNNPSILFYESGNEKISEAHMQEIKDLRDNYDPHGGRAAGCREMLDSKVAEYGGEMLYVNLSDTKPMWAMEYMRDEGLRKYWDEYSPPYHKDGDGPLYRNKPAKEYNRNQDSFAIENVIRWYDYWRERPGMGKRVSSGGVNIIFSDTNTHHRGAENYRRSGEVDAMRIPKDGFFTHQVMWNGWVDVEQHSSHILGHWNYKADVTKDIFVISSGEKVELFVNGQSKGFGERSYDFLFTFKDIDWEPGELKAVSYDSQNKVLSQAKKITAGDPEQIKLTLHNNPTGFKADGADLALIDVEVVDAQGRRCPTSNAMINFELQGPADWRGGIAQGPDNYILAQSLPVECGINRVIIRSTTTAGTIKISAQSEGLQSASVEFKSQAVKVTDGLSLEIPGAGLPSNLERDTIPDGKPYTKKRKSIEIVAAKAGSNQEQAHFSYDGNQETRWTNDGDLSSAWITYEFAEETEIDEIALKLSGWRTRSYPIVVTAGEKQLFAGLSERNLGFFYISFEPLKTQSISIRLFGESEYEDIFNIVEITGKLDKETENDKRVRGVTSLNLVDVEVFRKVEKL